jgi:hypothetical protein
MVTPRGRHRFPLLGNPERPACRWPQPLLDTEPTTCRVCASRGTSFGHGGWSVPQATNAVGLAAVWVPVAWGTASATFWTCVQSGMRAAALSDGYCGTAATFAIASRWDDGAPSGIVDKRRDASHILGSRQGQIRLGHVWIPELAGWVVKPRVHPKGLQVHVRRPEGAAYTALGVEPLRCGVWGEPMRAGMSNGRGLG